MSDALDQLIERVSNATKRAQEGSDGRDSIVVAGELLLSEVREAHPTVVEQEKVLTKWVNLITQAVHGFSDFQECFWEASHFFQLIIENYSHKTVLQTVKACVAVFNTEHSSDNLVEAWAIAATKRCAGWLKVESSEELSKPEVLKNVKNVNTILHAVAEAGEEFKDIIKDNTDLKDSLAELNLFVEQTSVGGSVFSAANQAAAAAIKKEIVKIEALSSDSAEGVITALEQAVDLEKPSGTPLFEAYNAMCEEQPADLQLQVRASSGPLAQLAVQAIFKQNEEKEGKKHLFLEALVFCKLLLQPWDREDAAHMEAKLQIATSLLELDVVTALLSQFRFWAVEWKFSYGDCGDPAIFCVLELARYFPNVINDKILPNADAVAFIRTVAEQHRGNLSRPGFRVRSADSGGFAATVLEALMDGLPEPVAEAVPGGQGFAFGAGADSAGFGGFGLGGGASSEGPSNFSF